MAKQEKKKQPEKTIAAPEPAVTADVAGDQSPEIDTVEQLTESYPVLVKQIKNETAAFINNRTADEIKRRMPELYMRIAKDAAEGGTANLSEKGFLLSRSDPFADGTLRTFGHLAKRPGLRTPYVLPFRDKNTKAALRGYIIRAEGGGDIERAKAARNALKKCV